MAQCAAVTGIPKERLQDMKARGCEAFRGSRIHEEGLEGWEPVRKTHAVQSGLPLSPTGRLRSAIDRLFDAQVAVDMSVWEHLPDPPPQAAAVRAHTEALARAVEKIVRAAGLHPDYIYTWDETGRQHTEEEWAKQEREIEARNR